MKMNSIRDFTAVQILLLIAMLGLTAAIILASLGCSGVDSIPIQPGQVVVPEAPQTVEFRSAVLHTCPDSVRTWPEVSSLTVTRSNNRLVFSTDTPAAWPNIDGCCAQIQCGLYRDGAWHFGPCDALRPFNSAGVAPPKEDSCACVPDGDARLYVPVAGEEVRFRLSGYCRHGQHMRPTQLSREAVLVW